MNKNRNSSFIVITGFIVAISRLLLGGIETKDDDDIHVLIVMALVNYIALGLVILFLYNDFCKLCRQKVSNSGLDSKLKKRCNLIISICSASLLILYFVFGMLYMLVFKSADLNDIISIIALTLSIATNGLLEDYKDSYYKFIIHVAKKSFELEDKCKKKKDTTK